MIKAVIFDMFETLVSLFQGRTYYGENIAADVGVESEAFRKEWHATEHDRTIGVYTIEERIGVTLKKLGVYSEEAVNLVTGKRREALNDTFSPISAKSLDLLKELKKRELKIGLITNAFSDERDFIRRSELFSYFDATMISCEQGLCKPDPAMFFEMTKVFDISAEECLYVGDGGSNELYAARKAGMQTIQATWFYKLAFEPHIPCHPLHEFKQAGEPIDVIKYLDEEHQ